MGRSEREIVTQNIDAMLPHAVDQLPSHVDADRFRAQAASMLRMQADAIAECTPDSLSSVIVGLCKIGLYPGAEYGHAWVIPYNNRYKDDGGNWRSRREAQIVVGYKGYIELATRAGMRDLVVGCVYENDEFDFDLGTGFFIRHRPWWHVGAAEGGARHAAYAVGVMPNGGSRGRVLSAAEVLAVKTRTPAWINHEDEQWIKTAIRRAAKLWPQTESLAYALHEDVDAVRERTNPPADPPAPEIVATQEAPTDDPVLAGLLDHRDDAIVVCECGHREEKHGDESGCALCPCDEFKRYQPTSDDGALPIDEDDIPF